MRKLGKVPALDGVRGLAVLVVVLFHGWTGLVPGGWVGVDVFFVLSGFLITRILVEERSATGRIRLSRFYGRRALRLLPALLVLLIACSAFTLASPMSKLGQGTPHAVLATLGYYSNFLFANQDNMGLLTHTWSLSVEEQFYLIWPALLMALLLSRRNWVALAACGAGIIEVNMWRLVLVQGHAEVTRIYSGFDTRADALLMGCALALAMELGLLDRLPRRSLEIAALVGATCIGLVAFRGPAWIAFERGGYTLVALAAAAVIALVAVRSSTVAHRIFEVRWLVVVGQRSYGLYLWHFPVQVILFPPAHAAGLVPSWVAWPEVAQTALVLAISWTLASLSWVLVERPCLGLKERLSPPAKPRLVPAPARASLVAPVSAPEALAS
jgi:peptidoglycan/LPS O-acetylase OafA/YrhL